MKEAGYDRYDAMGKQAIESAINTGLYAGLDKPVRSFQANQAYLNPLQAEQLSQAKTEFEWKKQARRPLSLGNGNYLDPVSGLTFTEDDKGKRTYNFSGKDSSKSSSRDNRIRGKHYIPFLYITKKLKGTLISLKGIPAYVVEYCLLYT